MQELQKIATIQELKDQVTTGTNDPIVEKLQNLFSLVPLPVDSSLRTQAESAATNTEELFTLISKPEELRKELYKLYLSFEDSAEGRSFLKQAVEILKDLVASQTEAFFNGYDVLWEQFESVGAHPIDLDRAAMQQLFFDNGYHLFTAEQDDAENTPDFILALERAKNTHNAITTLIEELGPEKSDEELGVLFFKGYLKATYSNHDQIPLPVGTVRFDTTTPVTSVRLVCEDSRDFNFLWGRDTYSAGFSAISKNFLLDSEGAAIVPLPVTVIRGSADVSEYEQIKTRVHEDAHQQSIVSSGESGDVLSAELREKKEVFKHFQFDAATQTIPDNQKNTVLTWRQGMKKNMKDAATQMRDEVQANITEGVKTINQINANMSDTSTSSFYDYVCNTQYRIAYINKLSQSVQNPEERDALIAVFKADVLQARLAYTKVRLLYTQRVGKALAVFAARYPSVDDETAKKRLGLLMRNTSIDEFMIFTRYIKEQAPKRDLELSFPHTFSKQITLLSDTELSTLIEEKPELLQHFMLVVQSFYEDLPNYLQQEFEYPVFDADSELTPLAVKEFLQRVVINSEAVRVVLAWTEQEAGQLNQYSEAVRIKSYQMYEDNLLPRLNDALKNARRS